MKIDMNLEELKECIITFLKEKHNLQEEDEIVTRMRMGAISGAAIYKDGEVKPIYNPNT